MNKQLVALTLFLVSCDVWAAQDSSLITRAQVLHERILTVDAHADIEIPGAPSSYVGPDGLSKVAPEKMRIGGLDAVVMAIAVGPKPRNPEGYSQARQVANRELAAVNALIADPDKTPH